MSSFTNINVRIPNWLDKFCAWPVTAYRKYKYGYTYRRIYLGEGEFTIVEPRDYYWLNKFNWCLWDNGSNRYARRVLYDSKIGIKTMSMHREIMKPALGLLVDHRNGDGLDNRRENLRPATHAQNSFNSRIDKSKNTSRYRGVCFRKRCGRWTANIRHNREKVWLGSFKTEIEAARAYDAAARIYHGEFAKLNFPKEIERSPKRLNLRSAAKSLSGRLANWLGASLNFP